MAAVGGMLASAVIKVVIGQIGSAIGGEIKLHWNMKKDLEHMKTTLEWVEAVLSDAETLSVTDNSARMWLKLLKDAMYDISDMLDDFEADTDLWAATMNKIKMPRKMKKMQKRLQKIADDRDKYRVLPETRSEDKQVPDIRETAGNVEEAEIIGRTDEKLEILARISGSTTQGTTILPICGIGGIGKTTLARLVFNDSEFTEYSRVWVYVSQKFELKKIGNTIISQLSRGSLISDDLHSIHTRLQELFTGKRILIILDDMWERDPSRLQELKAMLKQGEASKVLVVVTTREKHTAKEIGTVDPFELPPLSDQMCWDILKVKSKFETRQDKERLEPIGKEIAKKCGGVALAAQSLGHMLKSKTYDVWDSIRSNHIWNLSASKETLSTHEVLASLLLSYNFMPPHLKLCFAYCAIFPKGYNMTSDDLIHQWIALGFMEPSSTFSTWQLGESYITKLVEMSFLLNSNINTRYRTHKKGATLFMMHDLVHDLARSVMADEYNLEGPNCRYAWLTDCRMPLKSSTFSPAKIRSLHFADKVSKTDAFSLAKQVRVLDLIIDSTHDLTVSIGQLKQLRYLSLYCHKVPINPRVIGMLSKLNYLRIRSNGLRVLPASIGEMKGLMHLDLHCCWKLEELPLSFAELRELVYLDLSGCSRVSGVPKALSGLTKLQYLGLQLCQNLRGLPDVIINLIALRYLNLSDCFRHIFDDNSRDQTESFIDRICTLPNMKQLDLSWNKYPLIIPDSASHLSKLMIDGCCRIIRLPECVDNIRFDGLAARLLDTAYLRDEDSVNELEKVEIENCPKLRIRPHLPRAASWSIKKSDNVLLPQRESMTHIDCLTVTAVDSDMPLHQWGFLHHLLSLRELILVQCSNVNLTISPDICGALHSLQVLEVRSHVKLEELPNNMRQLTKLQSLTLWNCPSLRQLPQWIGELVSLRELMMWSCTAIMTLPDSIQQLTNLQKMEILDCNPELKKWCNAEENRMKLAHIWIYGYGISPNIS